MVTIVEGRRNETLCSFAGSMRRWGAEQTEIVAALREMNNRRCRPQLADRELLRIAQSVARYSPYDPGSAVHSIQAPRIGPVPVPAPAVLKPIDLLQFLELELPERKLVLDPWLRAGDLSMLHAWRGVGKTHVGIGIAVAVAGTSASRPDQW